MPILHGAAEMDNEASSAFLSLCEKLDARRLVSELQSLIAIPSVNPFSGNIAAGVGEAEIAGYYARKLAAFGFEVELYEVAPGRPNVLGILRGTDSGHSLMLAGHLDTVGIDGYGDPFQPKVQGGKVYGRGACDMKAALACFLEVARLIVEQRVKLEGDLVIAGTVDEEWQLQGSKAMALKGQAADYCIIGEPTNLSICPAHRGEFALAIRTFGRAAHASIPEHGHNAIADMGRVLSVLSTYNDQLLRRKPHPLCGHGRFSIGTIRGGTMVATVADFCEMEVDRRTLPGEDRKAVEDEYKKLLEPLARAGDGFRYELSEPIIDLAPLEASTDSLVFRELAAAFRQVLGKNASVAAFPAGTDGPNFGCPTIIFGPGAIEQAHTLDEFVEIEQLLAATKVYLCATLRILGSGAHGDQR